MPSVLDTLFPKKPVTPSALPPPPSNPSTSSTLPMLAAGTGATGLLAEKARRDVLGVADNMNRWAEGTQAAVRDGSENLANAHRAIESYMTGGRTALNSKILGMPIPYWLMQASVPGRAPDQGLSGIGSYFGAVKSRLAGDMSANIPEANRYMHSHYAQFKEAPIEDLRNYMQQFGFKDDLQRQGASLNEMGKTVMQQKGLTISNRLAKLQAVDPDGYAAYRKFLPSLVKRLAGVPAPGVPGSVQGGLADVYRTQLMPHIGNVERALEHTRNLALPAAAVFGAAGLYNKLHGLNKQSSAQQPDSGQLGMTTVAPWAAGAPMIYSGIQDYRRPLDIGISYGEMPSVGAGHKTPASAMRDTLNTIKERGNAPEFNLHTLNRSNNGWVDPKLSMRSYDGLVDTGWGAYVPKGWGASWSPFSRAGNGDHNVPLHVRAGGYMGVQTDLGDFGMPGHSARFMRPDDWYSKLTRSLGFPDQMISYDPNISQTHGSDLVNRMRVNHTGEHGFPTMTNDALDTLRGLQGTDRSSLISDMLADTNVKLSPQARQQLQSLEGKRVLAITGSGRGDQVGYKALELQKALEQHGLADKWKIMAMLGDSETRTPFARQALAHPNIISFGKLPQRYYVGLPGLSDYHDASSGTSALMEALGTRAHLNFNPLKSEWKDNELRALGNVNIHQNAEGHWGIADIHPHAQLWRDAGIDNPEAHMRAMYGVDLDRWNKGNKEFAARFPGVTQHQSVDDIIAGLKNESLFGPQAATARGERMSHMIESHARAKENLIPILEKWLGERRQWANMMGHGKLGLGAGLLGLGAYPLLKSHLPIQSGSDMNKAASAPIPTEAIAAAPGFFRRNAGKLGLAALAGGAGVYGASKLDGSKSTPLPTPAPYASQFADNARDFAQQYGALIPSAVGLGLGGLGGMMNGNPVSGALTGLGTGAGLTAGLAGGNALANTLYGPAAAGAGQPDWKRILTVLAGGGAGAFAGNKITGALTGAHKKNHHDE